MTAANKVRLVMWECPVTKARGVEREREKKIIIKKYTSYFSREKKTGWRVILNKLEET